MYSSRNPTFADFSITLKKNKKGEWKKKPEGFPDDWLNITTKIKILKASEKISRVVHVSTSTAVWTTVGCCASWHMLGAAQLWVTGSGNPLVKARLSPGRLFL